VESQNIQENVDVEFKLTTNVSIFMLTFYCHHEGESKYGILKISKEVNTGILKSKSMAPNKK